MTLYLKKVEEHRKKEAVIELSLADIDLSPASTIMKFPQN